MKKIIKTHKELLELHGASVTCDIEMENIKDSKVSVFGDKVFICQNVADGEHCGKKFGYKYSWVISDPEYSYEEYNRHCKNIVLVDQTIDTDTKASDSTINTTCQMLDGGKKTENNTMKKVLDKDSNMFITTPEDRNKLLKGMMELAVEEERPYETLAKVFSIYTIEGFDEVSDFISDHYPLEDIMEGALTLSENGIKNPTPYDLLEIICDHILFKFETGSDFIVCIDDR